MCAKTPTTAAPTTQAATIEPTTIAPTTQAVTIESTTSAMTEEAAIDAGTLNSACNDVINTLVGGGTLAAVGGVLAHKIKKNKDKNKDLK